MPPIKSRRPGARVTNNSRRGPKKALPSSVKCFGRPFGNSKDSCRRFSSATNASVSASPRVVPETISNAMRLSSTRLRQKPSARERGAQKRLDLRAHALVGVTGPGHVRLDGERRAKWAAADVGHDHAGLSRDEFRAEVVRVAADAERESARAQASFHQRAQVCREAVVTAHQFVELPAARRVLILKAVSLAGSHGAERAQDDLFVNRREFLARAGEEARGLRVAVRDCRRLRGAQSQRRALARQAVETLAARALAAHGPGDIAEVLLDEREFRLHGKLDVGEASLGAAVARRAGQNPAASLLVHQPARAIYRINDDAPRAFVFGRAARQNDLPASQAFGDEHDRRVRRDLALEEVNKQILADAVNRVDCVAFLLALDRRQVLDRRTLARLDDLAANQLV